MKNITILIPIHKISEDYKEMLNKALESVEDFHNDVKVSLVCPAEVKKELTNLSDKLEINIVTNKGETDFCSQVNLGIDECDTEWLQF